jgi:hypothetical protein
LFLPVVKQQLRICLIFLEKDAFLESRIGVVLAIVEVTDEGQSQLLFDLQVV